MVESLKDKSVSTAVLSKKFQNEAASSVSPAL